MQSTLDQEINSQKSQIEEELQNEKNANAELKKKLENLETMFNETSGEIEGNFETISSRMTTEHQLLQSLNIHNVVEKSVKLTFELEKWKSEFNEKFSSLEIELQNEKDANADLKKKLEDRIETNGITLAELSSTIDAKVETLSSRMITEHNSLRNDFNKLAIEKVGEMEEKLSLKMDNKDQIVKETFSSKMVTEHAKDQSLKEALDEMVNALGEIGEGIEKLDKPVSFKPHYSKNSHTSNYFQNISIFLSSYLTIVSIAGVLNWELANNSPNVKLQALMERPATTQKSVMELLLEVIQ